METQQVNVTVDDKHQQYIDSLCEKRKKGYEIAKRLLGNTFNLEKSIGYNKWLVQTKEST